MNPIGRVIGVPAELIAGLRVLPKLARDMEAVREATEAMPDVRQATTDMERHTRALPDVLDSLNTVAEGIAMLKPMDERMQTIEGAMPVLVEVQQHLAQLPETMDSLDAGVKEMSANLDRLLIALEQLSANLTSLDGAMGPIGRLAQRIPGGKRTGDIVVSAGYAVVGRWREQYDVHDLTRAGMLMEQWGVAQFAHRPFGTLSEGERKRAQIARALMPDPELLLLDEPGAGLDLGGREDLVARLSDLARYHYAPAQVLVTHHVEEIPPGYDHALLLRAGEVVAVGPADDVLTDQALSETFGLKLSLTRTDGRFTARRAA
ncbi:MAG: ATP-binding cassette domain-containing protein [Actinomycetota bacterium]|nr:ATP-binding cassette domain-containing protein [Actinomycetota bacterium]